YLINTGNYSITYGDSDLLIHGYADANLGGDRSDRKSTTGYIFFANNGAISWTSHKQTTSLSDASREALVKLQLFKDIRTFTDNDIPTINSDKQGALIRILAITNAQNTLTSATILFFKPSKMIKYHGLRPDISESSKHS